MNRERRITHHARVSARRDFGMKDVRFMIGGYPEFLAYFEGFADEIEDAKKRGLITPEQAYDMLGASVIIKGIRESDEKPGYVLAEVTNFIEERDVAESDVIRAADFASILSAATGAPVIAAVIGDGVSERDRRLAERIGVEVSLLWGKEERDAAWRIELKNYEARRAASGRL